MRGTQCTYNQWQSHHLGTRGRWRSLEVTTAHCTPPPALPPPPASADSVPLCSVQGPSHGPLQLLSPPYLGAAPPQGLALNRTDQVNPRFRVLCRASSRGTEALSGSEDMERARMQPADKTMSPNTPLLLQRMGNKTVTTAAVQ